MYTEKKKPIDMTNREMQAKVAWVFVKPERIKILKHFLKEVINKNLLTQKLCVIGWVQWIQILLQEHLMGLAQH